MTDTVERFSNRVANYVKYRPDYPREIITYLRDQNVIGDGDFIADIGCGTGISTRMFLETGNDVIGVEPNASMRAAAAEQLVEFSNLTLVGGTSEATTLADKSVDVVTAAQAFHWFDLEKTKAEFGRILRPGGHIVLIWNERRLDADEFHSEYEKLLVKYSSDYGVVRHDKFDASVLAGFFDNGLQKQTFDNVQIFDFDGLRGRMLSSSYMPTEADAVFPAMIDELKTLFANHSENGRIKVFYDTNVYHSHV